MKLKIGVIFGGKTVEHEISIITANQAITSLNKEKYEIIPIYISKNGKMYTGKNLLNLKEFRNMDELIKKCEEIVLVNNGSKANLLRVNNKMFAKNIIATLQKPLTRSRLISITETKQKYQECSLILKKRYSSKR